MREKLGNEFPEDTAFVAVGRKLKVNVAKSRVMCVAGITAEMVLKWS